MQSWNGAAPQKGDLNYDGQVTVADAIIALQMVMSRGYSDASMAGDMIIMSDMVPYRRGVAREFRLETMESKRFMIN